MDVFLLITILLVLALHYGVYTSIKRGALLVRLVRLHPNGYYFTGITKSCFSSAAIYNLAILVVLLIIPIGYNLTGILLLLPIVVVINLVLLITLTDLSLHNGYLLRRNLDFVKIASILNYISIVICTLFLAKIFLEI